MKTIIQIIIIFCLIPKPTFAQNENKGFVYIGPTGYQALKGGGTYFGGSMGFGVYKGLASLGIGIEGLTQNKIFSFPVYADLRLHLKKSNSSPFVLFQPGYILSNSSTKIGTITTTQRGNLYLAGGIGFISKVSKIGITFQLKCAMLTNKFITSNSGVVKSTTYTRPGHIGASFGIVF